MASIKEEPTITDFVDLCIDDDDDDEVVTEMKLEVLDTPDMFGDGIVHDVDLGEVKQEYPDHQQATRCSVRNEPTQVKTEEDEVEDQEEHLLEPLEKRLKLTSLSSGTQNPKTVLDETACFEIGVEPDDEVDPLMPVEQATSKTGLLGNQDLGAQQLVSSHTQPSKTPTMDNIQNPTTEDAFSSSIQVSHSQPVKTMQKATSPPPNSADLLIDGPTCCVVEQLINCRFLNPLRSDEERQAILETGRPKVLLFELKIYSLYYNQHSWLAACNQLKTFYCWPCLLFAVKLDWSLSCVSSSAFVTAVQLHELFDEHKEAQQCALTWKPTDASSFIKMLLVSNLSSQCWSEEERKKIIQRGRPRPIMEGKTCLETIKTERNHKLFYEELYYKIKWLAGCTFDGKMYCWPCLLFGRPWTYEGMLSAENFTAAVGEHESTSGHLEANIKLKQHEFELKPKFTSKETCISRGTVAKHRSFVKYLTEVICVENKRQTNTDITWEDWAATLKLLAVYNVRLGNFLAEKTNSKGAGYMDKIITKLGRLILDCIEYAMQEKIKREVENSTYVAIILDHVSGRTNKHFLSVILRYVDQNATIVERFFKITEINYNRFDFMEDLIVRVAEDVNCKSKVVGFTYDGFLVPPRNTGFFDEEVRKSCPHARFFHYEEHKFSRILKQTLCHLPYCRHLFTIVAELAIFFETNSYTTVVQIEKKAYPNKQTSEWKPKDEFIVTLMNYYSSILEFFSRIIKQQNGWKPAVVVQAESFYDFLVQPANRTLVLLIGELLKKIEALEEVFAKDRDLQALKQQARAYREAINQMKSATYDSFLSEAFKGMPETVRNAADSLQNDPGFKEKCCTIVEQAEDMVLNRIKQMENAYFKVENETSKKEYSGRRLLLNSKNSTKILTFDSLPNHFNRKKLSSELLFSESNAFLRNKLFSDLVQTIKDYDLRSTVPEMYKLLQLALVIPMPSLKSISTPVVAKVREYVRNKKGFTTVDGLMWLERDLLTSCQNEPNFYGKIIDRVAEVTHTVDFPLKINNSSMGNEN